MISRENLDRIKIFEHRDEKKKYNMNVFTYIPEGNKNQMEIVFVMSGCLRDALNYLKIWIDTANEKNYIIIAPEFDKRHYSIADHEYGNLIEVQYNYCNDDIYTPEMTYGEIIQKEEEWIYHNIDEIYLEFIKENQLENKGYSIFGHSSGSQFTHRFLMLGNSKYAKKYLCANAGLYTFYDKTKNYPYGIKNLEKYEERLKKSLEKEVYILAGEADVKTAMLNSLPMDLEEGRTRYERAKNYFDSAIKYAKENKIHTKWQFISMPGVEHASKQVVPFAKELI